jgi:hypothetical protein
MAGVTAFVATSPQRTTSPPHDVAEAADEARLLTVLRGAQRARGLPSVHGSPRLVSRPL